jgi:hypothetical protein
LEGNISHASRPPSDNSPRRYRDAGREIGLADLSARAELYRAAGAKYAYMRCVNARKLEFRIQACAASSRQTSTGTPEWVIT